MQKNLTLKLSPSEAANDEFVKKSIADSLSINKTLINGFVILKKSYDARSKKVFVNLQLSVFIDEPFYPRQNISVTFQNVTHSRHSALIVGFGPAGLFAALKLIENGIKPVIVERGKDVRVRRRDLALLNKNGIINPESNYCFGEGGAGTYSDGKLYTRSNKRGSIERILNLFVQFGAEENILYEAHPHIGTNKLPAIITAMRKQIQDCGGEILFEKKVVDFNISLNKINKVITADGNKFNADAVILATGHSARDIFLLMNDKKILIEQKPFALGVRVEHPQALIDSIQYHLSPPRREEVGRGLLPPSSYSLVEQIHNKGVFSFCMCPGGIIAPASTNANELVVNGWSPSKRNNPFANSGIVTEIHNNDLLNYDDYEEQKNHIPGNLLGMYFQQSIEQKAFKAGGGNFVAPAQRMVDFVHNKTSSSLPNCSYVPGVNSASLKEVLPGFIHTSLQKAFVAFGKTMKGYYTNDAIVVATESRTSSPVKIPRDAVTLQHPQVENLYPCGEGAGYAGGIVSAAMDGERVASAIIKKILNKL